MTALTNLNSLAVVIPTHNRARLLRRAILSARHADEIVVVDDGSADETPTLRHELETAGVRYCRVEPSRGPGFARNVGVQHVNSELILFLDDDDVLLAHGCEEIRRVASEVPGDILYLHNCVYPDGKTSISPSGETSPARMQYSDWLRSYVGLELKPVARRALFEQYRFEDTGASGEGLLWGKVIRHNGAVVGRRPIVLYDVNVPGRLTSTRTLIERAPANAWIAERWLQEFGGDLRRINRPEWRSAVRAAVVYSAIAGNAASAKEIASQDGRLLPPIDRTLVLLAAYAPRGLLVRAFALQRRDLASCLRPP